MSKLFGWFGDKKGSEPAPQPDRRENSRAEQLEQQAIEAVNRRDYAAAEALCSDCVALHIAARNGQDVGRALRAKADVVVRMGDGQRARKLYAEAAEVFSSENLRVQLASARRDGADLALTAGDLDSAKRLFELCLTEYDAQVDRRGSAAMLYRLGTIDYACKDFAASRDKITRSLELYRALDAHPETAVCLLCLSAIASLSLDNATGNSCLADSLTHYKEAGGNAEFVLLLIELGGAAYGSGRVDTILLMVHYALPVCYEMSQKRVASPPPLALTDSRTNDLRYRLPIHLVSSRIAPADNEGLVGASPLFNAALDLGGLAYSLQRSDIGKGLFDLAVGMARARYDNRSAMRALGSAVSTAFWYQSYWVAREYCNQLVGLARELRNTWLCADALYYSASMAWRQGELEFAKRTADEAMTLYKQLDSGHRVVITLTLVGRVMVELADTEAGIGVLKQAVSYARNLGEPAILADALIQLGYVTSRNESDAARSLIHEAEGLASPESTAGAFAIKAIGDIERRAGNRQAAGALYCKSLSFRYADGDWLGCAFALEGCGLLFARPGTYELAAAWLGKAAALRAHLQTPQDTLMLGEYNLALAQMRLELGHEEFNAAWAKGAAMQLPDVVAQVCSSVAC